jgi:hypothetical protein
MEIKIKQAKIKNILIKMFSKMKKHNVKRENRVRIKRRMMMTMMIYLRLRVLAIKMVRKLLNGAELKN